MIKILITGSKGQLGSELSLLSGKYSDFQWVFADRILVPFDNLVILKERLDSIHPQIIINCAAYTSVDKAESEKELADKINHLAVEVLANWTSQNSSKLIHISTDYVFDGTSSIALNEQAYANPINQYGKSKLAGENICLKKNPNSIILRTSWVYSRFGNNFVKTMSRLMQERDNLNVVSDQIGSPTYAADLAEVIISIILNPVWKSGIYNYSNEGEISWYEFALAIKEIGGYKCVINAIPTSQFPTPAKRPVYSLLDKRKIKKDYNITIPHFKESLKSMMNL